MTIDYERQEDGSFKAVWVDTPQESVGNATSVDELSRQEEAVIESAKINAWVPIEPPLDELPAHYTGEDVQDLIDRYIDAYLVVYPRGQVGDESGARFEHGITGSNIGWLIWAILFKQYCLEHYEKFADVHAIHDYGTTNKRQCSIGGTAAVFYIVEPV